MNADEMYKEMVDEVGTLPVICGAGIEHSDEWIEVESKGGEEKIIICPICGQETIQEYVGRKQEANNRLVQDVWQDFINKTQIST